MSGLMRGALETGRGDGLRHRHESESGRQQLLPGPTATAPVLYSTAGAL